MSRSDDKTNLEKEVPTWKGGCHCGKVRFTLRAHLLGADAVHIVHCNCSICTLKGFLHLIVEKECFSLLSSDDELQLYTFGTHQAKHTFCANCGIHSFYPPRSHPEGISVNVHALDGIRSLKVHIEDLKIQPFDGQNWENNIESLR
ncbi:MAG: GFA family protein [Deltaproteobacteria bacterium]|nr:GFA family protein [Deltaproteobacteria bacterium]